MDDKEFYSMYDIPQQQFDDLVSELSLILVESIVTLATTSVKKEIRTNPNNEELKRAFNACCEYTKKKLYQMTDVNMEAAMAFSFREFDQIMRERNENTS